MCGRLTGERVGLKTEYPVRVAESPSEAETSIDASGRGKARNAIPGQVGDSETFNKGFDMKKGFIIEVASDSAHPLHFRFVRLGNLETTAEPKLAWFTEDFHEAMRMANNLTDLFGKAFCPIEFAYID